MVVETWAAAATLVVVIFVFVIQAHAANKRIEDARDSGFENGKRSVIAGHIRLPRQPEFVDVKRMSQKDRDLFFFEFERRCMEKLDMTPAEVEFFRQCYAHFLCKHDATYEHDGEIILVKNGARV